jgi:hypothetical protein
MATRFDDSAIVTDAEERRCIQEKMTCDHGKIPLVWADLIPLLKKSFTKVDRLKEGLV